MRRILPQPESFYHVFNRGNDKQAIFLDMADRRRFLLTLFTAMVDLDFHPLGRRSRDLDVSLRAAFPDDELAQIKKKRMAKLVGFTMMTNHFHLLIEEGSEGGIAKFMQRLQNSYTKYFNEKYKRTGHLFAGPYKIVPVESNEQLLYLSAYIHRNPRELPGWEGKEGLYPWSSCRDYLDGTDWQGLLHKAPILDQLENGLTYKEILENSAAKEKDSDLENVLHPVLNKK